MGNLEGNAVVETKRPINEIIAMANIKEKCNFLKKEDGACTAYTKNANLSPTEKDPKCFTQLKGSVLAVPLKSYKNNPLAVDLSVKKTSQEDSSKIVSDFACLSFSNINLNNLNEIENIVFLI